MVVKPLAFADGNLRSQLNGSPGVGVLLLKASAFSRGMSGCWEVTGIIVLPTPGQFEAAILQTRRCDRDVAHLESVCPAMDDAVKPHTAVIIPVPVPALFSLRLIVPPTAHPIPQPFLVRLGKLAMCRRVAAKSRQTLVCTPRSWLRTNMPHVLGYVHLGLAIRPWFPRSSFGPFGSQHMCGSGRLSCRRLNMGRVLEACLPTSPITAVQHRK